MINDNFGESTFQFHQDSDFKEFFPFFSFIKYK